MQLNTNHYITRLQVRPDDIDLFRHVHSSKYLDYVLAARYDQMRRYYGCSMDEFLQKGFGWVVVSTQLIFKRPLSLQEHFDVETWIEKLERNTILVDFTVKNLQGRTCCHGWANYAFVDIKTGRSRKLPEWVVENFSL